MYLSGCGRSRRVTRSRRSDSISAFCAAVARLVNGKAARLRARRIRVEITMSDSGPVPRSHSPVDVSRLSRFIRGFLLPDRVAQAGRLFIPFCVDGLPKLVVQFEQLGLTDSVGQVVR